MDFNQMFDKVTNIKTIPLQEQFIEILQKTWANISADYCMDILKRKRPNENIDRSDIARVNVLADEARCAAYSYMNRWQGTKEQRILDEWSDLRIEEQNDLLVVAFPEGQVYGV